MSRSEQTDAETTSLESAATETTASEPADLEAPGIDAQDAESADPDSVEVDDAIYYQEQVEPEYGVLGFTLREFIIVTVWVVAFVVSFFAVSPGGGSVWTRGIDWLLTIGLPTAAVFLIILRRFSPDGIRRVGSLGIDQFASVAATVAAVVWAQVIWHQIAVSIDTGMLLVGWVPIVAEVAVLALVVATVAAPLIPRLRDDFEGRMETLAHRSANPVRPVISRPRQERSATVTAESAVTAEPGVQAAPVAPESSVTYETPTTSAVTGIENDQVEDTVGVDSTHMLETVSEPSLRRTRQDQLGTAESDMNPFWILAATERDVLDERGNLLFSIGPEAWTLVIEDRDGAYVVRHDDGRIGYLHDISDITKD